MLLAGAICCAQVAAPSALPPQPGGAAALPNAPSAQPAAVVPARPQAQSWWLTAPADAPYRALTSREKFQSFVHQAYSPYTFLGGVYGATFAQASGDPYDYGGGMEGWGKRIGAHVAGREARNFFGTFLFPTLFHQDPRYFARQKGTTGTRVVHALKRVVITRADDGRDTFNSSGLLSIAFTSGLATAWAPESRRTPRNTMLCMLDSFQGDATTYLLREFTPDILRFFKRVAPRGLRKLEEKMPAAITGDTSKSP